MQVITSHVFPQHKVSMRGVNSGINDTNVLLLINGNPIKNANGGGSSPALYNGISLSMIDRIEVIRGPGSVLYGSNAFAGVINIVTKNRDSLNSQTSIEVILGSFDSKGLDISSHISGENHDFILGVNIDKSDGDTFDNILDRFGNIGTYHTGFEQTTLLTSGTIGKFSLTSFYTDFEVDNGGGLFKLEEQTYLDIKKYIAIGYEDEIFENWQLKLSYLYNDQLLKWQVNNPINAQQVSDSQEKMAEAYIQGHINDNISLIAGASYSMLKGEVKYGFEQHQIWRQSYFIQSSMMANPTTKIVVGLQWNRPQESKGDLSSRIGLVKQFYDNWWLKLSYGEAFRSPFATELFVVSPGLVGNSKLKPEQIKTYEAQLMFEDDKKHLAISLYNSKQSSTISRAFVEVGSPPSYINHGGVDYKGIEIEGKLSLTERLLFTFNANYQTSETNKGVKDDSYAPNEMIKLGFVYEYSNRLSLGVFNRYIGKNTDLNETKGIPLNNPIPVAYNLLTANIEWDLDANTSLFETGSSSITLFLDNIFDEEVFAPDVINQGTNNSLPSHSGFNASINFKYSF